MTHQPISSFYEAQTGEFIIEVEELLKLFESLTRVDIQRTGRPYGLYPRHGKKCF
ncbi:hypothetical protein ES319_D08G087700v1 [Gossypium barbadense]|uniref:Uncharacterized protein n=1 Tax=Gossypium barbadense TaxID=3634 RepID=A0A5J5QB60_GOSBA|nr:hypothetical protein ES319_D08G087700v1 [Gossypium barbadense]